MTLEKGETIVIIKNVPAEVSTTCRHYDLSSEMTQLVLEKGNEAYGKGTELEVVKLQVA